MKNPELVNYRSEYGLEVVKMWRQSFQRAMNLEEHNRFAELSGQLDFLASIDPGTIQVAIDPASSDIAGFMAVSNGMLHHLYVHVDWQGMGVGSMLLNEAKACSPDGLELFTFVRNTLARAFYESRGFTEVRRGFAALEDNPWATSNDQLADIKFRWDP